MKDYYEMLGLDRKASAKQIQTAAQRLLEHYPAGSEQGERVLLALDVLLDRGSRRRYDRQHVNITASPSLANSRARAILATLLLPVRPIHWFSREWVRNLIRLLKVAKGTWLGNFLKQLFWMEVFILCTGNLKPLNAVDVGLIALVSMDWTIFFDVPLVLDRYRVSNYEIMPDTAASAVSSLLVLGLCCSVAFANYHYPAFYLSAPEMYLLWVHLLVFLKRRKIARMEQLEWFDWNGGRQ